MTRKSAARSRSNPAATYVFDKGYLHYGWWTTIHQAGAFFVTRPKENMGLRVLATWPLVETRGDGFIVLADEEVALSSKGDSKLPIPLRRIRVRPRQRKSAQPPDQRHEAFGGRDRHSLQSCRWQIELLFRWMKQHLKIRKFLGRNENAIKLQIYAAMIAYALLRLAAKTRKVPHSILRYTDLVRKFLFERRHLGAIEKPPAVNPNRKRTKAHPIRWPSAMCEISPDSRAARGKGRTLSRCVLTLAQAGEGRERQ